MKTLLLCVNLLISSFCSFAQTETVSEAEATHAATVLEAAVNQGDVAAFSNLIDEDRFINRIAEQSEATKIPGFMIGVRNSFTMASLSDNLVQKLQKSSYRVLRIYQKDKQWHLLFRLFGDNGINYHDFALVKINDSVKAEDFFVLITGENMTTTLATFLDATVNSSNSLTDISEKAKTSILIKHLADSGDFQGAKRLIDESDSAIRYCEAIELQYLHACRQLGDSVYKKAMLSYADRHPGGSTYLKMLDFYFLQHDYPKALRAINRLDSAVQGDPVLNYYRAVAAAGQHHDKEAELLFQKSYLADPSGAIPLVKVINTCMKNKDSAGAKSFIQQYKSSSHPRSEVLEQLYDAYPSLKQ